MRALLIVAFLTCPAALLSQTNASDYVPRMRLPNGNQLIAVYVGQKGCGASRDPELQAAVRQMKPLLARQAETSRRHLSIVGVALDWVADSSVKYLQGLGTWDEIIAGNNWANHGAERYIWREADGRPLIPQVIFVERTVSSEQRIVFGPDRVIRRVIGTDSVIAWVRAGAPIPGSSPSR